MSTFSLIIRQFINGLQLGSIYALVALGYSMVYGIMNLLNFAHGDIIMVGAYTIWIMTTQTAMPVWLSIILTVAMCMVFGIVIEKVAYKPLRESPRISLLITAIGVSYLLENLAQLLFGADTKSIPPFISNRQISLGEITVSSVSIVTIVTVAVTMVVLTFIVKKTRTGRAMRAVAEDLGAAQLMGVNVNRTISITFAIGSALAGIGSVLYCSAYPQASPTMGSMLGLKAFVAAVLGGIGSIPGAMLGGFAIGLVEALVSAVGLSIWKDAVVFTILIVVLLVMPNGILGKKQTEKV
ncbi:MAG: branched-chain amino acid ABC transporter permease [Oscillospiraceae bacterium]|jgi:branched-chain amino acid transport system permease protein